MTKELYELGLLRRVNWITRGGSDVEDGECVRGLVDWRAEATEVLPAVKGERDGVGCDGDRD